MAELFIRLNVTQAKKGAKDFKVTVDQVKTSATQAAAATDRLSTRMTAMGKTGTQAGSALKSMFAGIGALVAVRAATKAMASFEETMVKVGQVSGATGQQFESMTALARQMGEETRFTATQAGEGMLFLARTGFTVEESMAALPGTLDFAVAGMLDLGEAADLASNVVKQFGLAASETARVGNDLVVVSNRANTDVRQLGEAFKFAGPVAALAGSSVEETAAIIGVLGDRGIQATLAGTGLRMSILRLVDPTTEAAREIMNLGLNLDDVNPVTVGVTQAFANLGAKTKDLTVLSKIFGARTTGVASIIAESTDRVNELVKAEQEAKSEQEDFAESLDKTLTGAFFRLKSAIESMFLSTGDAGLLGALKDIVNVGVEVFRFFAGSTEAAAKLSTAAEVTVMLMTALLARFVAMKATRIIFFFIDLTRKVIALNTAMRANPAGVILTGVGLLAAGFAALASSVDQASAAMEHLNEIRVEARKGAETFEVTIARLTEEEDFAQIGAEMKARQDAINKLLDEFKSIIEVKPVGTGVMFTFAEENRLRFEELLAEMRGMSKEAGDVLDEFPELELPPVQLPTGETLQFIQQGAAQLAEFQIKLLERRKRVAEERAAAQAAATLADLAEKEVTEDLTTVVDDYINALHESIATSQLSARAQAIKVEIDKAEAAAERAKLPEIAEGTRLTKEQREALIDLVDAKMILAEASERQNSETLRTIQNLRDEIEMVRLTDLQARQLLALRDAGPGASMEQQDEIERLVAQLEDMERVRRVADGISSAFIGAFEEIRRGADDLSDVLANLLERLTQVALQQFLFQPFQNQFGSWFTSLFSGPTAVSSRSHPC
jgi:TP901 family phage tail tape measure protein